MAEVDGKGGAMIVGHTLGWHVFVIKVVHKSSKLGDTVVKLP